MQFVQNFPFFSILLTLMGAVASSVMSGKRARHTTLLLMAANLAFTVSVMIYTLQTGDSYAYKMGHFPAPWGNEIRVGVLETVSLTVFLLVILFAVLFDFLCRLLLVRNVRRFVERTRARWDDTLFSVRVLRNVCHVLSAILLAVVLPVVFEERSEARTIVLRLMQGYVVVSIFRLINALLYAFFHIAASRPAWQNKPIKGLRQTAQGSAVLICVILVVSILIDKSPRLLLTGLGASAAIVMLVFKDSIMGFVSGIQLSANDMLQVGDWISVPRYGADGTVEEVSLTTVKIRNWDNTIVMLPPYLLTSDSFQNWRGMQQSGGRRVMRSVSIDMTSVRFCTPEMLDRYRRIDLIRDYIDRTEQRIERYNAEHGIAACERRINGLHQTNLGIFRAYLVRYLQQEVPVNRSMTLMVRQMQLLHMLLRFRPNRNGFRPFGRVFAGRVDFFRYPHYTTAIKIKQVLNY